MERSSDSQSWEKKIIDQILGYINFCIEICAHLGHFFASLIDDLVHKMSQTQT